MLPAHIIVLKQLNIELGTGMLTLLPTARREKSWTQGYFGFPPSMSFLTPCNLYHILSTCNLHDPHVSSITIQIVTLQFFCNQDDLSISIEESLFLGSELCSGEVALAFGERLSKGSSIRKLGWRGWQIRVTKARILLLRLTRGCRLGSVFSCLVRLLCWC